MDEDQKGRTRRSPHRRGGLVEVNLVPLVWAICYIKMLHALPLWVLRGRALCFCRHDEGVLAARARGRVSVRRVARKTLTRVSQPQYPHPALSPALELKSLSSADGDCEDARCGIDGRKMRSGPKSFRSSRSTLEPANLVWRTASTPPQRASEQPRSSSSSHPHPFPSLISHQSPSLA